MHLDKAFFDKLPTGIYVYNFVTQHHVFVNQQYSEITGYTPEQIQKMNNEELTALLHPEDCELVSQTIHKLLQSKPGEVLNMQFRQKRPDGKWMWCLARNTVSQRDENGNALEYTGNIVDITESKNQEKLLRNLNLELQKANENLNEYNTIVSHDLLNPLNTSSGFINLIKEGVKNNNPENQLEFIEYLERTTNRMRTMVKGLLDYSKLGENIIIEETDTNTQIDTILEDLDYLVTSNNAAIKYENLPTINAYQLGLQLVFQNLITNAIKYKNPNTPPQIEIRANRIDNAWCFQVEDNGLGIKKSLREKVFNMFQRGNLEQNIEGSGVGLAQCRKIINLHNGKIWIESNQNEGITVCFTIPDHLDLSASRIT